MAMRIPLAALILAPWLYVLTAIWNTAFVATVVLGATAIMVSVWLFVLCAVDAWDEHCGVSEQRATTQAPTQTRVDA